MMPKKRNPGWLPKLRNELDLNSSEEKLSYKLLKREELSAKKSHIKQVLTQQYITRYGSKHSSSAANDYIRRAIDDMLKPLETPCISEEMIQSLEVDIINNSVDNNYANHQNSRSHSFKPTQEEVGHITLGSETADLLVTQRKSEKECSRRPSKKKNPPTEQHDVDTNQWSVVSAILALGDEEQKLKEHRQMMSKNNNFRSELDKQSLTMRAREEKEKEERLELAESTRSMMAKYEEDTRDMKLLLEDRIKREKHMRITQIEERKEQREIERRRKADSEDMEVAQIRKLTEEEEKMKMLKKLTQRKIFEAVREEDKVNKTLRGTTNFSHSEFEPNMTRYSEDEERTSASQDGLSRSTKRVNGLSKLEARRLETSRSEREREEKMTNDQFSKALEDDVSKERVKAETKRREIAQSSEFNMKLLNRKELKKQQDKEDAIAYRLNMQRDADALQAIDAAKNEKKRLLMLEVKQTLDEQVKNYNKRKISEKALSEKEIALNKGFFERIQSNPDLRERLREKLHPIPLGTMTAVQVQ